MAAVSHFGFGWTGKRGPMMFGWGLTALSIQFRSYHTFKVHLGIVKHVWITH